MVMLDGKPTTEAAVTALDRAVRLALPSLPGASIGPTDPNEQRRDAMMQLLQRGSGDKKDDADAKRALLRALTASTSHAALVAALVPLNVNPPDLRAVCAHLLKDPFGRWFLFASASEKDKLTHMKMWKNFESANTSLRETLDRAICTEAGVHQPHLSFLPMKVAERLARFGLRSGPGDDTPNGKRTVHLYDQIVLPFLNMKFPGAHEHPKAGTIEHHIVFRRKELWEVARPVLTRVASALGYDVVAAASIGAMFERVSVDLLDISSWPSVATDLLRTIDTDRSTALSMLAEACVTALEENSDARILSSTSQYGMTAERATYMGGHASTKLFTDIGQTSARVHVDLQKVRQANSRFADPGYGPAASSSQQGAPRYAPYPPPQPWQQPQPRPQIQWSGQKNPWYDQNPTTPCRLHSCRSPSGHPAQIFLANKGGRQFFRCLFDTARPSNLCRSSVTHRPCKIPPDSLCS